MGPKLKEVFLPGDIRKLLMGMKDQIMGSSSKVPEEALDLIMSYYADKRVHHDPGACDLLQYFKFGDKNFNKAAGLMLENSLSFSCKSLFQLAMIYANRNVIGKCGTEQLNDDTFNVIEKAVQSMVEKNDAPTNMYVSQINWMASVCSAGGPKSKYFHKMVEIVGKYGAKSPDIISAVLQQLEHKPALLKQATSLSLALVDAYAFYFDSKIGKCGHANYLKVIIEMKQARDLTAMYLKDGRSKFDAKVVRGIKSSHSGKKKLMKMLGEHALLPTQ